MQYQLHQKATGSTIPTRRSWPKLLVLSAVIWLPLAFFILLAIEVRGDKPLKGDVAILQAIHSVGSGFLTSIMTAITELGSAKFVVPAVLLACAVLYFQKYRRQAYFLALTTGGISAINILFKHIFRRDRPELWKHLVHESSFSFPSGHAMITSTLALTVIVLLWRTRFRIAAVIIGSAYFLAVGFSRLYLGVHYPSDVFAGWCVSILWVAALGLMFIKFHRNPSVPANLTNTPTNSKLSK